MNIRHIIVLTIILLAAIDMGTVFAQPDWARKGVYVEYSVRVSVSKTELANNLGVLNKLLDGYVDAIIRYTMIDYDAELFTLEAVVTKITKGTGGPGNLAYIHIVSQGEANTIKAGKGYQLIYHWYFKYRGVSFPETRIHPYPSRLFVYMDVSQNPKTIAASGTHPMTYNSTTVIVEEYVKAEYDDTTGFLNKLEYIQAFQVENINAIIVTVTVKRIGSNIHLLFGYALDPDTLIAIIAGSILAGITAVVVFYHRVKRELG